MNRHIIFAGLLLFAMSFFAVNIRAQEYRLPPIEINISPFINNFSDTNTLINVKSAAVEGLLNQINKLSFIKIKKYGIHNALSTININGISSEQNKVMVEGIQMNSPQNGYADLSTLPNNLFDDAVIALGPQSSAYGNNAIGGVVDFSFSTTPETIPNNVSVAFDNGHNYSLYLKHNGKYNAGFFSSVGKNDFAYKDMYGRLRHRENNSFLKSTVYFKRHNIFFMNNYLRSADPGPTNMPNTDAFSLENNTFFKVSKKNAALSFSNFHNHYQNLRYFYGPIDDIHNFSVISLNASQKNKFGFLEIVEGVRDNFSFGNSTKLGKRHKNEALFSERLKISPIKSFGIDGIGGITYSSRIYLNYKLQLTKQVKDFKIISLFSSGYNLPTFNELYWPATGFAQGNENLKAEKGQGTEIRITDKLVRVRAFYYLYDNLIKWQPNPIIWMPANIDKVRSFGFDVGGKYSIWRFRFNSGYSFNQTVDVSTGKYVVYLPQEKINASVKYKGGRFFVGFSADYEGFRFLNPQNTTWLNGFLVVNSRYGIDFGSFLITATVDNMLNSVYAYEDKYPMPLRLFEMKMKYKF